MLPKVGLDSLAVFVDKALTTCKKISFNAGSHTELMQVAYKDFEKYVQPKVVAISKGSETKPMSRKEKLILDLNEDLATEWGTIIRYTYQAGKSVGIYSSELRQMFHRKIQDEIQHAAFLTDVIIDLGGQPTTIPKTFVKSDDLKTMLQFSLEMELQDVENYKWRAEYAASLGKTELKVKLEEMAADEAGHAREIRRLLKGMSL